MRQFVAGEFSEHLIGCTAAVTAVESVEAPSMDGDRSKFLLREDKGVSCDALPVF